jgi:hypothetical protein
MLLLRHLVNTVGACCLHLQLLWGAAQQHRAELLPVARQLACSLLDVIASLMLTGTKDVAVQRPVATWRSIRVG